MDFEVEMSAGCRTLRYWRQAEGGKAQCTWSVRIREKGLVRLEKLKAGLLSLVLERWFIVGEPGVREVQ